MSLEEKFNIQYKIDHDMFTPEENELIKAIKEPIMSKVFEVYDAYFDQENYDGLSHEDFSEVHDHLKDLLLTYDQNYHKR